MALPIIIVGAGGRMGRTIAGLVQDLPELTLAGMVERPEYQPTTAPAGCIVSDDLEAVCLACSKEATIIDFSAPESSMHSAELAAKLGNPLVIGTTGLSNEQKEQLAVYAQKAPILWSPNMSVGVNVLLKVLPTLTKALGDDYDADIVEIHHKKKKDAPSGTGLRLGEAIAQAKGWNLDDVRCSSRDGIIGARPHEEIGIQALRGGGVVGVHTVYYMGPGECIEVTHRAESRENFARGAIRAAKWLASQKAGKLFTMGDCLGLD